MVDVNEINTNNDTKTIIATYGIRVPYEIYKRFDVEKTKAAERLTITKPLNYNQENFVHIGIKYEMDSNFKDYVFITDEMILGMNKFIEDTSKDIYSSFETILQEWVSALKKINDEFFEQNPNATEKEAETLLEKYSMEEKIPFFWCFSSNN